MMKLLDTHIHFWDLAALRSFSTDSGVKGTLDWIASAPGVLGGNRLPPELESTLQGCHVDSAIFVQCVNRSSEEIAWVQKLAEKYPFIKAMTAGLPLEKPTEVKRLIEEDRLSSNFVVGARFVCLLEEIGNDYFTNPEIEASLGLLERNDLVFEVVLEDNEPQQACQWAETFPNLTIVIDHLGMPKMTPDQSKLETFKSDMSKLARFPNISCKISGLVLGCQLNLEAGTATDQPNSWYIETARPFVHHCLEVFGPDRCMFGSNWPVCGLAGRTYQDVVEIFHQLTKHLSKEDKEKVSYGNARRIYNI